jgi:hypothetical protein
MTPAAVTPEINADRFPDKKSNMREQRPKSTNPMTRETEPPLLRLRKTPMEKKSQK